MPLVRQLTTARFRPKSTNISYPGSQSVKEVIVFSAFSSINLDLMIFKTASI